MTTRAEAPDLEWFADVVWGPGVARVVRSGDDPVGRVSFIVIPSAARARFLLPDGEPRAAQAALCAYNRLRPPGTRVARSLLSAGLRTGAVAHIFKDRLLIAAEPAAELHSLLGEVLGARHPLVAAGLAPRGPNRKPVLQVFSSDGRALGYVKVGWNDVTVRRVEREAAALRRFADEPGVVGVPRLIHLGTWRGLTLGVTEPLPRRVRRVSGRYPCLEEAARISRTRRVDADLGSSGYLDDLTERVDRLDGTEVSGGIRRLLEAINGRHANDELPFGPWHGDWVPWNLARDGDRLYALDWEHWSERAPVGLDVLHWHFQVRFILRKRPLGESLVGAAQQTRPQLSALRVPDSSLPLLVRTYLAEMALRAEEAVAVGAPPNARFHPFLGEILAHAASDRLEADLR